MSVLYFLKLNFKNYRTDTLHLLRTRIYPNRSSKMKMDPIALIFDLTKKKLKNLKISIFATFWLRHVVKYGKFVYICTALPMEEPTLFPPILTQMRYSQRRNYSFHWRNGCSHSYVHVLSDAFAQRKSVGGNANI